MAKNRKTGARAADAVHEAAARLVDELMGNIMRGISGPSLLKEFGFSAPESSYYEIGLKHIVKQLTAFWNEASENSNKWNEASNRNKFPNPSNGTKKIVLDALSTIKDVLESGCPHIPLNTNGKDLKIRWGTVEVIESNIVYYADTERVLHVSAPYLIALGKLAVGSNCARNYLPQMVEVSTGSYYNPHWKYELLDPEHPKYRPNLFYTTQSEFTLDVPYKELLKCLSSPEKLNYRLNILFKYPKPNWADEFRCGWGIDVLDTVLAKVALADLKVGAYNILDGMAQLKGLKPCNNTK